MNLLSKPVAKTFRLLSIGQRGVGKTVFLAGSYAELHSYRKTQQFNQLWFECQDAHVQEDIEKITNYIVQTGEYPPLTIKVTTFNFSLKHRRLWGAQTLSRFCWWDVPGEICSIDNPEFQSIIHTSHGCCFFIDAYALMHNKNYLWTLNDIIEQVVAIANLVYANQLQYAFALILTKCDLLDSGSFGRQLEESLKPLTTRLEAVQANYQTFYSLIPIVNIKGVPTLKPQGAANPLLWLVWELSLAHNPGSIDHPFQRLAHSLPTNANPRSQL